MHSQQRQAFYQKELSRLRNATAVFAVSDYYAMDLIHFLTGQGISVPRDISVAGFDDIPLCQLLSPALTTVRQDGALRAKIALESLETLGRGEAVSTAITLPVSLVQRESTAKPGNL